MEDPVRVGSVWVWPNGLELPVISGGSDDDEDDDDESASGKKFTQSEVNRIMSKEKKDGRRAGRRELLVELGLEDEVELREIITAHQEDKSKNQSELDRLRAELESEKKKREDAESKASLASLDSRVIDSLMDMGMTRAAAKKARKLIDATTDMEDGDISELIQELKTDMPSLFQSASSSEEDGKDSEAAKPEGKVPSSDPGRTPPKPKPGAQDPAQQARERLMERHASRIRQDTEK